MTLRIATKRLSLGAQGPDVVELHRALAALGRRVPAIDRVSREYGAGTAAVIRALQEDLGLVATGVVDDGVVRMINARLAGAPAEPRVVRGAVRDRNGKPLTAGAVQVFGVTADSEQMLGTSPLDPGEGTYQVSYQPPQSRGGRVDLRLEVHDASGPVDTTPDRRSLLVDAGALEVVDFVTAGATSRRSTEFESLADALAPLLAGRDPATLIENADRRDISLLASQSGFASAQVAAFVRAHLLATGDPTPPAVFYAWLRHSLPGDIASLHAVHTDVLRTALRTAVAQALVPPEIDGRTLEDYLGGLAPPPVAELNDLFGRALNPDEATRFVAQYQAHKRGPDAFWRAVETDPEWSSRAADLKFTVQLGALTNNHVPLVRAIRARPDITQASDLARLTEEGWRTAIQAQGVGVPSDTPGATPEEQAGNYARQLVTQVEAAFPARALAERLESPRVAAFLKAQPSYDLRRTYPAQFFTQHPAAAQDLQPQDRQQLQALQRVFRLTGSVAETLALSADGIQSAQQIAQMAPATFAAKHRATVTPARAAAIHTRAQRTQAASLALFGEYAADLNRTSLGSLPRVDTDKQAAHAASRIADWPTLFGAFDLCACDQCTSVHSPAAYFVDILQFLRERDALDPLMAPGRRADLGDIELSCENTNTTLPTIDLVNEILEHAVAPLPAFASFPLDPAREADMAQPTPSAALASAFTPPLQSHATIETVTAGARWRIWDEACVYAVVKDASGIVVTARSRQTAGSPAQRRAAPQFRRSAAYGALADAVFPWTLPFSLAHEEARVWLGHLHVPRHALIAALRPQPQPVDPGDPLVVLLAAERLGLTDAERRILVAEPLTPPHAPPDFWDGATATDLSSVRLILDRAGLTYADFAQVLAAWFVNPSGTLTIVGQPVHTCDPSAMHVEGLSDDVLARVHAFVRLWRVLGWTIEDTDRAVRALADDAPTTVPALTNRLLVRLDHVCTLSGQLRLPVLETLALWTGDENRLATLARQLGLTAPDLATAIDLTGLDPFSVDRSQDSLRLADLVRQVRTSGFDVQQLDYLVRRRVDPAAAFVPAPAVVRQTLIDVRERLAVGDQGGATERLAGAVGLPADITGVLLQAVRHGGVSAAERLADLGALAPEQVTPDNPAAQPPFAVVEALHRAALVIRTLELSISQTPWLLRENEWLRNASEPPGPVSRDGWISLLHYQRFRRDLSLDADARQALTGALDAVAAAGTHAEQVDAKQQVVTTLATRCRWSPADVQTLIGQAQTPTDLGLLRLRLPEDYRADLLVRVGQAMTVVTRLGVPAQEASAWCEVEVSADHARAIGAAARARHDDQAWLSVQAPLQDALRGTQRDALVSYLVARPQGWAPDPGPTDARRLYEHFLIDVEMSPCQLTSRLKQAAASVQLYVQRCLMGLTPDVASDDPKWAQWAWMKQYRAWEANRKIWLYPENWIEPQLRDDKTPFFKDLENELLQSDLTDAAAEAAFGRYLEHVDRVSRLEIVGMYQDDESRHLHVFGRTFHTPQIYFHRRRDGQTGAWEPWQRMDVDIEGHHLIPVVWGSTLMLIWPTFSEKAEEAPVTMPPAGQAMPKAGRYWDIQLAWSEYRGGKWTGKNLSQAITVKLVGDDGVVVGDAEVTADRPAYMFRPAHPIAPTDLGGITDHLDDFVLDPGDNPHPQASGPSRLIPRELFSFKGLVDRDQDRLTIRAFLRRDYRRAPDVGDPQVACCFGEFRFIGCRKIVTSADRGSIDDVRFPVAPTGTRFDHMWFSALSNGFTAFDGTFPPGVPGSTLQGQSVAGTPGPTVARKHDIPVLGAAPATLRVLAPHQDAQFVGDRPFVVMDARRAFLATSTGTSGTRTRPDLAGWTRGDLAVAWRADYFPVPTEPAGPTSPAAGMGAVARPLTVLARGPAGRRVSMQLERVEPTPAPMRTTLLPTFWTTRRYRFLNFHHPYLCAFSQAFTVRGLPALLSLESQQLRNAESFAAYQPADRVETPYPIDEVDFQADGTYAEYNWELFFHAPLLIADQLSKNQRFEEAQRWFHFIFDPTGKAGGDVPQRYWRTKPFFERLASDYAEQSVEAIEEMAAHGPSSAWETAVAVWRDNPFSPHAVARLRTTAYQKTVVMKYLDNLIAWGDQLFRRETLESIAEATQLYILAAQILGPRPDVIGGGDPPAVRTFNSLTTVGVLSNPLVAFELLIGGGDETSSETSSETPDAPALRVPYFCVPENATLLGYWSKVADRLFKIRHCMNMEGQVRQLPLFEPPIDPALLVRAFAAGLSLADVLGQQAVSLPNYRFAVMLPKAQELAAEVRSLGAEMLSAMEKRDAEALSTLRSGQELRLLQAVRDNRVRQVEEAEAGVASLTSSRQMAMARHQYYASREFLTARERASRDALEHSLDAMKGSASLRTIAAVLGNLGIIKLGSPTTSGLEIGPSYVAGAMALSASALDVAASVLGVSSQLSGRLADFDRRKDEWDHQTKLATFEVEQAERQLVAAEIRLAIARQELKNHDRQVDDARDIDEYVRGKFTNRDLYQWMVGQISGLYFRSYQLAHDLARRAERCFTFELGVQGSLPIVGMGQWDSLKQGLLAGERLTFDLRRLETAYLDRHVRDFELTRHVSVALLDPLALARLRQTGACTISLSEDLFDLDYPGHYFRRIKSVSVTIPCVAGPYTTIACTLRLVQHSVRIDTTLDANRYAPVDNDTRFAAGVIPVAAIATSSGQRDSGVFELGFRDERYLPFEGAGVISTWSLELGGDHDPDAVRSLRQFDYDTITDIVLHVSYTAREATSDAVEFKAAVVAHLRERYADPAKPSLLALNLRRDYGTQWSRFLAPAQPAAGNVFEFELSHDRFPTRDAGKTLQVSKVFVLARCADAGEYGVAILQPPVTGATSLVRSDEYGGLHLAETDVASGGFALTPDGASTWTLKVSRPGGGNLVIDQVTKRPELEDLMLVLFYSWEQG